MRARASSGVRRGPARGRVQGQQDLSRNPLSRARLSRGPIALGVYTLCGGGYIREKDTDFSGADKFRACRRTSVVSPGCIYCPALDALPPSAFCLSFCTLLVGSLFGVTVPIQISGFSFLKSARGGFLKSGSTGGGYTQIKDYRFSEMCSLCINGGA